jgi:hypothetical protein
MSTKYHPTDRDEAAIEATDRLRRALDELEQAGRPDGEIVELSRDEYDRIVNNIRVASCEVVTLAERVS